MDTSSNQRIASLQGEWQTPDLNLETFVYSGTNVRGGKLCIFIIHFARMKVCLKKKHFSHGSYCTKIHQNTHNQFLNGEHK